MPTLQDVAKHAGVSTATVSKVLSNTPYVSETTRLKVISAVEELGYIPNIAARALSSGKTHILAVVFPVVYDSIFQDPLVLSILDGIEAVCSPNGYHILLSTPRLRASHWDGQYEQLLKSGYLQGIIALDNVPQMSVLAPVNRNKLPAVAIGYHPARHAVRSNDRSGGYQQMQHLRTLGHEHIAVVHPPADLNFSIGHRMEGLRAAAHDSQLNPDKLAFYEADFSSDGGLKCAKQLLREQPTTTAILCLTDRLAMGVIQGGREMGYKVPETLTVIGYDDIPTAAVFAPPLTTVDQQAPELGRTAAAMLFEILDGKTPQPIELETRLIVRNSSAAAR